PARAVTDAQGRYELPGCPRGPSYGVTVVPPKDAPYFIVGRQVADTDGPEPLTVDVDLPRGVLVRGRLIDGGTGKPVVGAVIYHLLAGNPLVAANLGRDATGP